MHTHTHALIAEALKLNVDPFGRTPDEIRAGITGPVMDAAVADDPVTKPAEITGEIKTALTELNTLVEGRFKELRERIVAAEAKGQGSAEDRENLAKILVKMEEIEAKGTKAARERQRGDSMHDALSAADERLERAGMAPATSEAKAAFWAAARYGVGSLDAETKGLLITTDRHLMPVAAGVKTMTVGNQSTGGFLAPSEFVREIIKGVVEWSPIRELAKVRQTSSKSSLHPVRTGLMGAAQWENEQSVTTPTDGPAYGMIEIPNYKIRAWVVISTEDLEDPVFDMEAEIREGMIEAFAIAEGAAFVNGDGDKKPLGLWTDANIRSVVTGSATEVTLEGLRRAQFGLHEKYARNATWLLRRASLLAVSLIKDGNDQFIFNPGIGGTAVPTTLLGQPLREVPDAPLIGANTYPIMYGDIRQTYTISDRVAISMKRDEFSNGAAENDDVNFWGRKRVGGQVTNAEASVKVKVAAS